MQHHLEQHGQEVWDLLCASRGGVLYVCGDARNMAKDVHRALHRIIVQVRRGPLLAVCVGGGDEGWRWGLHGVCVVVGVSRIGGAPPEAGLHMVTIRGTEMASAACVGLERNPVLPLQERSVVQHLKRFFPAYLCPCPPTHLPAPSPSLALQATGCGDEEAEAEVKRLSDSGRYHKDVW